jgi:serine protease Do
MSRATGVLVANVLARSPASQAGLQPGDILTEYDGQALPESRAPEDIPVFNRLVLNTPLNESVTLKGTRAGKSMTWRLTTLEREPNQARESELAEWGLTVRDLTRMSALEAQRVNQHGVIVDSIRPGGPSAEAKPPLRPGDIIVRFADQPVAGVEDLERHTRQFTNGLSEPKPVLVTFERDLEQLVAAVKLGPDENHDRPARPARAWLGVETQVLSRDLSEVLNVSGKKGVRVTKVIPASPAANAGVQVGDLGRGRDQRQHARG